MPVCRWFTTFVKTLLSHSVVEILILKPWLCSCLPVFGTRKLMGFIALPLLEFGFAAAH